jgi:hypothetical protein
VVRRLTVPASDDARALLYRKAAIGAGTAGFFVRGGSADGLGYVVGHPHPSMGALSSYVGVPARPSPWPRPP